MRKIHESHFEFYVVSYLGPMITSPYLTMNFYSERSEFLVLRCSVGLKFICYIFCIKFSLTFGISIEVLLNLCFQVVVVLVLCCYLSTIQ